MDTQNFNRNDYDVVSLTNSNGDRRVRRTQVADTFNPKEVSKPGMFVNVLADMFLSKGRSGSVQASF